MKPPTQRKSTFALSNLAVFIALAICIIACVVGVFSNKNMQTAISNSSGKFGVLNDRITHLEKQLHNISAALDSLAAIEKHSPNTASRSKIVEKTPDSLNEYLVAINDAMYQLEEIVDASGLKAIATNLSVDSSILKNLYDEQYRRKKKKEHTTRMAELNTAQHAADKQAYGEEVHTLYESARFKYSKNHSNPAESQAQRENALDELREKYPDANATAMVIAENAIGSVFHGSLEDAEKNYALLMENDTRAQVVTDWGIKATPTMQYYLASQYIENGRTQEAEDLIYQLGQNTDDIIFTAGQRNGRTFKEHQSIPDAIAGLREQLEQK